ncbi:F-box protein [Rhynchospora pubera]|uniref:F-box protein n=1 Tax=Rhynchospora pubera TaxID=906938 RepID=A0AAV8DEY2_9POAL|nr:F-box protein [Rhynchospora pubera]
MEEGRWDMLEWLGPDASACVMNHLSDPADVARAAAVSKSWCKFVISNEFGKRLCMKLCPEISNFTDIELLTGDTLNSLHEASSSISVEWHILKREHLVYTYLANCLLTHKSEKRCALSCIGASSTDNFPEESIENTLEPRDRVDMRPSYWSSGGQRDPTVQESLVYRLESDLYVVNEIRIQPFKAFFQYGHPIYSAKHVRIQMGHLKLNLSELEPLTGEEESLLTRDNNYVWTYTSPEYPMSQESTLQAFKLPRPILCIGGILKVELLGRVQKQSIDGLYYICVRYLEVIGHPLSPMLDVTTSPNRTVLRYYPYASMRTATAEPLEAFSSNDEAWSPWQTFAERIRQLGPNTLLNTLFGAVPVNFLDVEDDDDDDDDGDGDDGDDGDYDYVEAPEEEE